MSNISNQLIKDSYNYVLQSDLITGVVYRIGGTVPQNPKFLSGLTVNTSFTYSDGSEFPGFVLTCDNLGNATWAPVSATTSGIFVTGGTFNYTTGTLQLRNSNGSQVTISGLTDTYVTGGTISGTSVIFTYNDGNTFELSGITPYSLFSSYTASTQVTINNKLDISGFTSYTASTQPLILNSITGGTYSGGTLLLVNNSGNTTPITGFTELTNGIYGSTGVYEFSGLTKISSNQFRVSPVKGWIVDDSTNPQKPQIVFVEFTGGTYTDNYVTTNFETFVFLTSGGTIGQQTTPLNETQRRQNIFLGKLGHPEKTSINLVFSQPDNALSPVSQLRDMFFPIKFINGGIYPSANTGLTFNCSAEYLYGLGINFTNDILSPNAIYLSGTSPTPFQYRTQTGGTITNVTDIDPTKYDLNGVVTNIGGGGNSSTNQRIYLLQNGSIRVQYGQQVYSTLTEAIAGIQTETFTVFPNFINNAILIGILSINRTATVLSDSSKARFLLVSKFGEVIGAAGGIGTTTLQQAYNNSVEPEILINSTLDGISIKNGTGNPDNSAQLLQGISSGGTLTSFIRSDGLISGTSVSTPSFTANSNGLSALTVSATTYLGLPTDVFVTGGTYNSGTTTITFTNNTGGTFTVTGITASGGSGTSVTGGTFDYTNKTLVLNNSNGTNVTITGLTDTFVTGGTYNGSQILFTNNSGGTFVVSGLTATGFSANYYASFSDTTTQTVSGSNIATVWRYNTTEISNGISVVDGTKITVQNTGVYEIGYSAQIEKTQGTEANVTIWAKINGNDVDRSSSTLGLVSNSSYQLPFVSYIFELNAGDYVEFYFSSPSQYIQLTTLSGLTTPTRPDSPSVIIVAKQVGLSVSQGGTGDTFVTGLTYSNFNIILTQNRVDQYSGFTVPITGFTTTTNFETYSSNTETLISSKVDTTTFNQFAEDTNISLNNKLEISVFNSYTGATQTVLNSKLDTSVFSSYTANTQTVLSGKLDTTIFSTYTATTNPLILQSITGGSYNNTTKTLNLINNSGNTVQITGFTTIDVVITGGTYLNGNTTFTNNTGGTFTVSGSATYSSGILSGSSNWVSNGNGSVTLPTVQVALYNNSSYTEPVQVYTVSSGITGSGGIAALTDNDTNYIYIEYNGGSPRWGVSTDNSFINGSDIDLCYLIYRAGNFVHVLDFGNEGAGLPNKISNRIVAVDRFGRESGFSLGLSGVTGVVTLTSGVAWNGTNRQSLVAVNSQDDIFFKSFHSGGTWVYTTTGNTLNNTYYDNGTDIVLATASKYLVNWYFRGQEINDHLYEVYGTDEYDSVAEAQLSVEPSLPELITSHAFLTGRIIVQVGATTGLVESAFVQVFQSTQVTQHNDLINIQGGTAGEYYHLTSSEYSNNAYTNVNNDFSVGQNFNNGLSSTTISATTYLNLPLDITITGGTYNSGTTTLELYNNTGGTIVITGFTSGSSSPSIVSVTSVTESSNVITVVNSDNSSINYTIDAVTGGTYNAGNITLSGTGNVNGTQISTKILPIALTVISNTASTDASLSSLFTLTLTGNTTLATPINGFSGQRILYQLKQDGTGNKLLTLSSGFRSGPITVTLSTTANTTDYLGVIYNEIDDRWDVLALNKGYN